MSSPIPLPGRGILRTFAVRVAIFTVAWWALAEGTVANVALAAVVVLGAAVASVRITPPGKWRLAPAGVLRFTLFFLRRSMIAGVDVARRAIDPRLPISPGVLSYDTTLPAGAPRACFAAVVGLLPGTLSVGLTESRLDVHALDVREDVHANLAALERRIAAVFAPR